METEADRSKIWSELDSIGGTLSESSDIVNRLESKLVTTLLPPQDDLEKEEGVPYPKMSTMTKTLMDLHDGIRSINRRIADLTNRMEL